MRRVQARRFGKLVAVDAGLFFVVLVADQREVGDGRLRAEQEGLLRQMLVDDAEGAERAAAQEFQHRGIAALHDALQETQGRVVARELVVVEQHPAQDFQPLVLVAAAVPAEAVGQPGEDRAALGQPPALVLQHRDFAELVERVAVRLAARLAAEVVDEHRLPVAAADVEHQGDLVAVAGLADAVQLVFAHGTTLRARRAAVNVRAATCGFSRRS